MEKVLVTGGESMIGRSIVEALGSNYVIDCTPHKKCDLLDLSNTLDYVQKFSPDYIIHAAGWNGGIKWNKDFPATIYYRTTTMALNIYTAIYKTPSVKKSVGILASCSYPDIPNSTFTEEQLWNGKPNNTVECHGLAKRIISDYGRQISKQYDKICVSCILNNSYGPYDSFHPEKTKVVGALIRRFVEAKQQNLPSVTCWGSGKPLREFVYCKDAGKAIVEVLQKYNDTQLPINITSGEEVSIYDLTMTIAILTKYGGEVIWDINKPDGQMKKSLNNTRFKQISNMEFTPLKVGLKETIDWYINNKEYADNKGF